MSSKYEFWLTDDAGRRITLLKHYSSVSYSRSTQGYGTIQILIPLEEYLKFVPKVFQPDWRIDAWRKPDVNFPIKRESSYLLRKYRIYDQDEGVQMIEFFGRSPIDILRRAVVTSSVEAQYKKTDYIDDMMKAIVTQEFITNAKVVPSASEFSVDMEYSLGPTVTRSFRGRSVLDILTDLKATSFSKNRTDSSNKRIYFDVVEGAGLTNGFGYIFKTFANYRGIDKTNKLVFSTENGNLKPSSYYEDYLEEITVANVNGVSVTSPDATLSRWNSIMKYVSSSATDANDINALANQELTDNGKIIALKAAFLNTPGSNTQPRSLYGVDWDLGDLLPVQYAGKNLSSEVKIVWVSVNEDGEENIVGQNTVGE